MVRRFLCLAAVFALAAISTAPAARAEYCADYVRLHVVAASDSAADQAVKLAVRDACLRRAQEVLADCPDADTAYAALRADRAGFLAAARGAVWAAGSAAPVRVETGVYDFPDRVYGDVLVPAGEYRALRVVVGAGEGHNWWCVLYPTLCVLDENVYAAGGEVEIEFYSAIWQWLESLFHS